MDSKTATGLIEVRVPTLPESVTDATLVEWHKQPGDAVRRDDNLVDLETDKVVLDTPAPADGVLREIRKSDGETVTSDELIALIEVGAVAGEKTQAPGVEAGAGEAVPPPALSPAARHMVEQHHMDPADIAPTGKGGRLTKQDVVRHLGSSRRAVEDVVSGASTAPPGQAAQAEADERTRRVPMSRLRARIAERMLQAQQSTATLSTFNEVNLQAVMELRARNRDRFEDRHGVKLGLMSFFVKASVAALKAYPVINASVEGDDILYHDFYDIGIAVASARGLVVPVLRDADRLGQADIERAIAGFAQRAEQGNLTMDELTGGTFTITNGGVFGSMLSTPVLNPPQSAILGMHRIQERPVAEDGDVVIRPMMYVALSYDHRIIDGRDAVRFLVTVKELLEDPARLLLEV